jgi:O-methyltransferase involved in polyketide biosynthesis
MTAAKAAGANRALTAARSRYAEDELKAAMARGATQYVIIGAGMDAHASRNQNANLRVFVATDFEGPTLWPRLPHGRGSVANLSRAPAARSETTGSHALENTDSKKTGRVAREQAEFRLFPAALEGAGFRPGEATFFSWLGAAPYAGAQAIMETLAYIGSMAPGSALVFDYTSHRLLSDPPIDPLEGTAMDALASRFAAPDESPQLLVNSRALDRLLRSAGFHEIEDLGTAEIDKRYFGDRADGPRVWPGSVHFVSARI